ncbi:MAG: hypothetical protein ACREXU_00585 [Gammaproteobacteria bacterium]
MAQTLGWLGPAVVLAGAIGLLQVHGIAFWSSKLGYYGIAWSVLLEAIALWLWSRTVIANRLLALLASVLLLLGPLYQVGTPILEGLASAEHSDRARAKEIPMVEAEIRGIDRQLATFTTNSEKRSGWLPAIEETQAQLAKARERLAVLYRDPPRSTARIEAKEILVIVMECTGLVLFQISAVLAITVLAREGRARRSAEPWRPFGFAGHWGSMHGVLRAAPADPLPEAPGTIEAEASDPGLPHRVRREHPANRDPLEAERKEKVVALTERRGGVPRPGKTKRRTSKARAEGQALGRVPRILPVEQGQRSS